MPRLVYCATCGVTAGVDFAASELPAVKLEIDDAFVEACTHPQGDDPAHWNCPNLDQAIAALTAD